MRNVLASQIFAQKIMKQKKTITQHLNQEKKKWPLKYFWTLKNYLHKN